MSYLKMRQQERDTPLRDFLKKRDTPIRSY